MTCRKRDNKAASFSTEGPVRQGAGPVTSSATPVLIAVDAQGIRYLAHLPRLNTTQFLEHIQEQAPCLLKREAPAILCEERKLAHPTNQVGSISGQRQLSFLQELGVTIQDDPSLALPLRHIQISVLLTIPLTMVSSVLYSTLVFGSSSHG